jgi:hypothetical protein
MNDLIRWLNPWSAFDIHCKHGMWTGRSLVKLMRGHGPWELAFEKTIQCLFFWIADDKAGIFYYYTPSGVFLDLECGGTLLVGGNWRKQIKHLLIIDFNIAHSNSYCLVKSSCYFMIYLSDRSWYNASVFIFSAASSHRECLSCTSLPVTHDRAIVSLDNTRDELLRTSLIYFILTIINW